MSGCRISPDGAIEWLLHGELHRDDGPAVVWPDGTKTWWLHGKFHREDGPAIIHPDGTKSWWLHGILHREGGPAVVRPDVAARNGGSTGRSDLPRGRRQHERMQDQARRSH